MSSCNQTIRRLLGVCVGRFWIVNRCVMLLRNLFVNRRLGFVYHTKMQHYYEGIDGMFDSLMFYRDIAKMLPNSFVFVEVGVWVGRSMSCLGVELLNRGKTGTIFAVALPGLVWENALVDVDCAA